MFLAVGWEPLKLRGTLRLSPKAEPSSSFPLALCPSSTYANHFSPRSKLNWLSHCCAVGSCQSKCSRVAQRPFTSKLHNVAHCFRRGWGLCWGKKNRESKRLRLNLHLQIFWRVCCQQLSWGWYSWGTFFVVVVELMCGELQWRNRGACGKQQNVSSKLPPPVK